MTRMDVLISDNHDRLYGNHIDTLVKKTMTERCRLIEIWADAYLAEKDLMPSQVELCEQRTEDGLVWFFRKRTNEP